MIEPLTPMGSQPEVAAPEEKALPNRLLARTLGYFSAALLLTGVVAFAFAWIMSALFIDSSGYISETGATVLLITLFASLIAGIVTGFVFTKNVATKANPPWISYFLYSAIEGILFGSFIIIPGVTFGLIGEAFLITFLTFFACFLIGYFAKGELSILKFLAAALGIGILISSIIFLPIYVFTGYQGVWLFDFGISVAVVIIAAILVALDARNLKKMASAAANNRNVAMMCAMNLYCDFMIILVRVLYLLLLTRRRD